MQNNNPSTTRWDPDNGDSKELLIDQRPNFGAPITIYHGTSVGPAILNDQLRTQPNGDLHIGELALVCRIQGDFSHGENTANYWTTKFELAKEYAWQNAFWSKTNQIVFKATFNPAAAGVQLKIFEGPDLTEWRTAVTWGWMGGNQPPSLQNHNVIAGWIQTSVTTPGKPPTKVYWPSKKDGKIDWQIAITSKPVLSGLTHVEFQDLGPATP
ncbi:hypothetical protein BDW22DRAFT_1345492 [Trametopsis cervina]|nr:hypothetical protein BDW22DRAFT_1345492 [Trametopsis cervina]